MCTGDYEQACLAKGMKAKHIMDLYLVHGSKIFKKRFMHKFRKPMFDDAYVNSVLHEYFKDLRFIIYFKVLNLLLLDFFSIHLSTASFPFCAIVKGTNNEL